MRKLTICRDKTVGEGIQVLIDPKSIETIEPDPSAPGITLIFLKSGRKLMCKRSLSDLDKDLFGFPGGRCNEDS